MFDRLRHRRSGCTLSRIVLGLCATSTLWIGAAASAMPASPHAFTEKQPDGTVVALRLRGDEHLHWMEDERGFTVVREHGRFVYGKRDLQGNVVGSDLEVGKHDPVKNGLRPALRPDPSVRSKSPLRQESNPGSARAPATGTLRNLVVLLRFANHRSRPLPTSAQVDVLFNQVGGDPVLAPTGSVRDVYSANSYGSLTLDSTAVYWIDLPYTEQYYANGTSGGRSYEALLYALAALDQDPNFSFRDFDRNGDGMIDAITFLHSGYGAEWGGTDADGAYYTDRIWSHKSSLGFWTGREGISVSDYHISPALWGTSGSAIGRIGVISHELGHFLGLPDLYDVDGPGSGAGSWCLMANSWGFDGSQLYPPHLSAWSKMTLGWVTPTVITPGTYALESAEDSPTVYRIDRGYASGEYLLVESRQPRRFDARIPQGGLAIWHIDETAGFYDEGYPGQEGWPQNGRHYRVALLQADGRFDLEQQDWRGDAGDLYHSGSAQLGPATVPNTDSYQGGHVIATGNELVGISPAADVMSFTFGDGTTNPEPDCSDGIDNDLDRFIDFPSDPGCESADDDSEIDLDAQVVPISGRSLKVTESSARTTFEFQSTDGAVAMPAPASNADPSSSGARLVLSNPLTDERGEIALPAWGWSLSTGRLEYAGTSCSVTLVEGQSLSARCDERTLGGFTLDEASQGELTVKLELGEESGFCASFGGDVQKDSGKGARRVGIFAARNAPRPADCAF